MRRTAFVVLAVSLPLVSFLYGVAQSEYRSSMSEDWAFVVRGYDPRDLLRGHYISYRIDFAEQSGSQCSNDDPECCLCLSRSDETTSTLQSPVPAVPTVHRMSCTAARNTCDGAMRARYIPDLNRYYVPESRALEIERQLREGAREREARIVLSIDKMGRPRVKELRVAGRKLE